MMKTKTFFKTCGGDNLLFGSTFRLFDFSTFPYLDGGKQHS